MKKLAETKILRKVSGEILMMRERSENIRNKCKLENINEWREQYITTTLPEWKKITSHKIAPDNLSVVRKPILEV